MVNKCDEKQPNNLSGYLPVLKASLLVNLAKDSFCLLLVDSVELDLITSTSVYFFLIQNTYAVYGIEMMYSIRKHYFKFIVGKKDLNFVTTLSVN